MTIEEACRELDCTRDELHSMVRWALHNHPGWGIEALKAMRRDYLAANRAVWKWNRDELYDDRV